MIYPVAKDASHRSSLIFEGSRSRLTVGMLAFLLVLALFGVGGHSAYAQSYDRTTNAEKTQRVWEGSMDEARGHLLRRGFDLRRSAPRTHARRLRMKSIGGIPETGHVQSWVRNKNPNPSRNFDLTGPARYAGDVNGDGTTDYAYTDSIARDETTMALADETGKTALFYGGTPGQVPDQLLRMDLYPVGDLNDDGFDDALHVEGTSVRIYTGSASGYQDSGTSLSSVVSGGVFRGFSDVDGDGFEDALVAGPESNKFSIVYGASTLGSVSAQTYNPRSSYSTAFTYDVADIDQSGGDAEIVQMDGSNTRLQLWIYEIDGARNVTTTQNFPVEELSGPAENHVLRAVNTDGTAGLELVAMRSTTWVFERGSTAPYETTPVQLATTRAIPVGDHNGDGREDFMSYDANTETHYLSFGSTSPSTGLTLDTAVPQNGNDARGISRFAPQRPYGDVTGDGDDDIILRYENHARSSLNVGRRFFSVRPDSSARTPTDVTYPRANFFDFIAETNEIGDFNADDTTDFAIVRNDLGRIEVFYGGSSISSTPNLTISSTVDTLFATNVSSGDFNGDGTSDLIVGYGTAPAQLSAIRNDVYLGGMNPDATSDHTIEASTVGYPVHLPRAIGDVNDDGATDWMAADRGDNADYSASGQNVGIFLGGSTLPTTPAHTLQYPSGSFIGEVSTPLGDVNGDGIDDFAFSNSTQGHVDVYFGSTSPSFSTPADLELPVASYPGLAGGDFNGDGTSDIAAHVISSFPQRLSIKIFYGGNAIDTTADQGLIIPASTNAGDDVNSDGWVNSTVGVIESAGDLDGNGADELVLGSDSFIGGTNALLYRPSTSQEPIRVFRAPNQDASLGASQFIWAQAVGDFTGDGTTDFVFPQPNDDNDAATSVRVYRFSPSLSSKLPAPTAPTGVSASATTDTLTVGWDVVSDPNLLSYRVYRDTTKFRPSLGPASYVPHDTVQSGTTSYVDTSVSGGTTYYYRVTAVNTDSSESPFSNAAMETAPGLVSTVTKTVSGDGTQDFGDTGTDIQFAGVSGSGDVTVDRYAGEPTDADGITETNVSDYSVTIEAGGSLAFDSTRVQLAVRRFSGITDPNNVTIYKRDTQGSGTFTALETSVGDNGTTSDISDDTLYAIAKSFSQFALASSTEPLPVQLSRFDAMRDGSDVLVTWRTSAERKSAAFHVQRSLVAGAQLEADRSADTKKGWETVAVIDGAGTTPRPQSYRFRDSDLPYKAREVTYRLKQVDTDGTVWYSEERSVDRGIDDVELLGTYPNPAKDQATIRYALPDRQEVRIRLYDILGRRVRTVVRDEQVGRHKRQLDVSALPSGVYFLRLETGSVTRTQKLTVLQ